MVGLIVVILIAILGITAYISFKRLAEARNEVDRAWDNVVSEFERRRELIPPMIALLHQSDETAANKMRETMQIRRTGATSNAIAQLGMHESEVSREMRNLLIVTAGYPGVTKTEEFQSLAKRLVDAENRIDAMQKAYNQAVTNYNKVRLKFPSSLFAGMLDYQKEDSFNVSFATDRKTA